MSNNSYSDAIVLHYSEILNEVMLFSTVCKLTTLLSIGIINNNIIIEFGVWSDNSSKKNIKNKEDREKLGLAPLPKGRSAPTSPPSESANAYQKIDVCVVFLITYYLYEMLLSKLK